jgi:hypothetical protein
MNNKQHNTIKTIVNNINYIKHAVPLIFKNNSVIDVSKYKQWIKNSSGLYVIVHGLRDNPYTLGTIISNEIKSNIKMNKYDVIVPKVPFEGNCLLKDASMPIYNLILDYINKNPNKPIHMIGSSNGCRICSYIETKLRNIDVNIRITALSGAYNGSELVNKFQNILPLVLHKDTIEDMKINSKVNNKLKIKMLKPIIKGSRYYEFYASTNDLLIPNIDDCFPKVNANEVIYHKLVKNAGHINLGYCKYKEILNNSIEWMLK